MLTGPVFIAVYVQFALTLPDTGGKSLPAAGLVGNMVTQAWLPAMFGGPLDYSVLAGPFQLVDPADTVLLLTLLLAVAFVVHVDRTYLRSRAGLARCRSSSCSPTWPWSGRPAPA